MFRNLDNVYKKYTKQIMYYNSKIYNKYLVKIARGPTKAQGCAGEHIDAKDGPILSTGAHQESARQAPQLFEESHRIAPWIPPGQTACLAMSWVLRGPHRPPLSKQCLMKAAVASWRIPNIAPGHLMRAHYSTGKHPQRAGMPQDRHMI